MNSRSDLVPANIEGQPCGCPSSVPDDKSTVREGIMIQRVGNVLYTVHVRPSGNAKDNLESKLKKIIEQASLVSPTDEESEVS